MFTMERFVLYTQSYQIDHLSFPFYRSKSWSTVCWRRLCNWLWRHTKMWRNQSKQQKICQSFRYYLFRKFVHSWFVYFSWCFVFLFCRRLSSIRTWSIQNGSFHSDKNTPLAKVLSYTVVSLLKWKLPCWGWKIYIIENMCCSCWFRFYAATIYR